MKDMRSKSVIAQRELSDHGREVYASRKPSVI